MATCTMEEARAGVEARARAPGIGHSLKGRWETFMRHRAQRASVHLLRSLSDRSLHDIGIDRSEIESVVYNRSRERKLSTGYNWE